MIALVALVLVSRNTKSAVVGNELQSMASGSDSQNQADKYYHDGMTLSKAGNYNEAIVEFEKAIKLAPIFIKL